MKLTIFTPTYNRKDELAGLYESIIKAVMFIEAADLVEWLVVDDGSDMDIKSVVIDFQETDNLKIRYIRQKNGGKHTAFNRAIEVCDGDLLVCIDDDDRLTENSIADIFNLAKKYQIDPIYRNCGAIVGRVMNESGEKLGRNLKFYPLLSNTIEIRDKYHFWGEPEIYFVDKLKPYRFDVFEGEHFLTEAYLFDEVSLKYPFIYTDCIMMKKIFHKGGLTDNNLKIRIENPRGTEEYYFRRSRICTQFLYRWKAVVNRQRFAYWNKRDMPHRKVNVYEILARPISFLMYVRDRQKYWHL